MNFAWLSPEEQLAVLDARDQALGRSRDRVAALADVRVEPWSRRAFDYGIVRIDADRAWLAELRAEVRRTAGPSGQGSDEEHR